MNKAGAGAPDRGGPTPVAPAIHELYRLIQRLVSVAYVVDVDYDAHKVRVGVGDPTRPLSYQVSEWLGWGEEFAGNNRSHVPLELGDQVLILCPSGLLESAVIITRINSRYAPFEASSPDVEKRTWREAPDTPPIRTNAEGLPMVYGPTELKPIAGMVEYNRKTGVYRHWLKEAGMFRFEIGDEETTKGPSDSLKSYATMTKDLIKLVVGTTELELSSSGLHVTMEKNRTQLNLTSSGLEVVSCDAANPTATTVPSTASIMRLSPTQFLAQVRNQGFFSLRRDEMSLRLDAMQTHLRMSVQGVLIQFGQVVHRMAVGLHRLSVPGSKLDVTPPQVLVTSPQLHHEQAPYAAPPYDGLPPIVPFPLYVPLPFVKPPAMATGKAPYMPAK